jgi:phage antirepressor YoqD-like protein
MDELSTERKMTVKEVSGILGITSETVNYWIRKLYPDIIENGKTTYLSEFQVTRIKENIRPTEKSVGAVTDIEMAEKARDVFAWLTQKIEDEKSKRIEAERKNAVLMHVTKTYTATEIAKEIGMRSAQELNTALEERGIQYQQNGTWVPKANYAEQGYFDIKQEVRDDGVVIYHRKITQDGRAFIIELFRGE